jgi:MFS family permease
LPLAPSPSAGSSVFVCCLVNLNEALAGNIIWPLLPFLVARYAYPQDIGFYVGILGSSYFLGQVLFVRYWGSLSDRWGRRPVLLWGLVGSLVSFLWFGFARSYTEAVLSRLLCGAVNGNIAIAKIYVGEVTNKHTQASGFAWLSLTWGLGQLIAPALGGFLSDPAKLYPGSSLDTPLLRTYPFLLPALISVGFSALALALAIPLLKETPSWERRRGGSGTPRPVPTSEPPISQQGALGASDEEEEEDEGEEREEEAKEEGELEGLELLDGAKGLSIKSGGIDAACPGSGSSSSGGGAAGSDASVDDPEEGTPSKNKGARAAAMRRAERSLQPPSTITASSSTAAVLCDAAVGPAIAAYAGLSALQILFDELLPVFCSTPVSEGGLGWASNDIGGMLIVAGVVQISANLFLVPVLQRRVGVKRAFVGFAVPMLPFMCLFPLVARLSPWPHAAYAAVGALMAVRTLLFAVTFSSIMIALNNLSPAEHLGLVVSVAQAAASAIRTLGPTLGGGIFSASISQEGLGAWRLEGPYLLMGGLTILTIYLGTKIGPGCEAPPA